MVEKKFLNINEISKPKTRENKEEKRARLASTERCVKRDQRKPVIGNYSQTQTVFDSGIGILVLFN